MSDRFILIVEDERAVRDAIARDIRESAALRDLALSTPARQLPDTLAQQPGGQAVDFQLNDAAHGILVVTRRQGGRGEGYQKGQTQQNCTSHIFTSVFCNPLGSREVPSGRCGYGCKSRLT